MTRHQRLVIVIWSFVGHWPLVICFVKAPNTPPLPGRRRWWLWLVHSRRDAREADRRSRRNRPRRSFARLDPPFVQIPTERRQSFPAATALRRRLSCRPLRRAGDTR